MRIAVLDDDVSQTEMLKQVLEEAQHVCHIFHFGKDLMQRLRRETYDMLILDWNLPDLDGPEILRWARQHLSPQMPLLFITSRTSEEDIVTALNAGADDYMIKPIRRHELLARVSALLRRAYPSPPLNGRECLHGYAFDSKTQTVSFNERNLLLTQKEFDLALLFFRNMSRPLSRAHILEQVWGRDIDIPSRTLDTHVSRIRSKLDLRAENGFRLSPVYSYGYRLEKLTEGGN